MTVGDETQRAIFERVDSRCVRFHRELDEIGDSELLGKSDDFSGQSFGGNNDQIILTRKSFDSVESASEIFG